jgi:maleylpyruvate isomerase
VATSLTEARIALRAKQGAGERYDAANAPAQELDWARRGTAYFARILNRLDGRAIEAPSAVPAASRRDIVAYVGLEGRLLAEMIGRLRAGDARTFTLGLVPSQEQVMESSTLPEQALRNLFIHSAIHLDVEWRDLRDMEWNAIVPSADGVSVAIRDTPRRRAWSLWTAALALGADARSSDIPAGLTEHLPFSTRLSFAPAARSRG